MNLSRKEYIDIIHSYIVLGQSQKDIADRLDIEQPFVSTVLKSYGLNEKNYEKRGTNTDRGMFPNLTLNDIAEFVDSGSKSFYTWYDNLESEEENSQPHNESLLKGAMTFADDVFNSSHDRTSSNGHSDEHDDKDSSIMIFLGLLMIVVCFLYKSVVEFCTNLSSYFDILIQGDYILFLIIALVCFSLTLKWLLSVPLKYVISELFLVPLGASIIVTGIKFYMDLRDTSLPFCFIVIGLAMLIIAYKKNRR